MEFKCPKCKKVFRPHPFIAMKHPSQAKCPECNVKGKLTERGRKIRESRFHAINQANAAARGEPTLAEQLKALKGGE